MSVVTVLAFDPGGTTGWAAWRGDKIVNPDGIPEYFNEQWWSGEIGPEPHHMKVVELCELMRTEVFHLVTESFEFRQGTTKRTGLDLSSKEYIGVMTLWCDQNGVQLHQQTAALGKGFITDRKLKAMNLYDTGMKHARDAKRHLLYYMINNMQMVHLVESWKDL